MNHKPLAALALAAAASLGLLAADPQSSPTPHPKISIKPQTLQAARKQQQTAIRKTTQADPAQHGGNYATSENPHNPPRPQPVQKPRPHPKASP